MDRLDARELAGRQFACLEGCGFCCTFPPEASRREAALLRARVAPAPLPVTVGEGRTYLALQNKCGACTLLERRECQAYDLRPAHCRYFPFHVHFGPAPEAYVNYTCRGVEFAEGGDLRDAFTGAVVANTKPADIIEHEKRAVEAYALFERQARKAGAWGDVRAVADEALAGAPFTRAWMERAIERADEDTTPEEMIEDALAPFSASDVTKRPFWLDPDTRWITFAGPGRALEMDEKGALAPFRDLVPVSGWHDIDAPLAPYLDTLTRRGIFTGGVYAIVDDLEYETSVEEATWWRLAEIVADLAVRVRVLSALGVAEERLADETARFYDSTFLDSPTIGGFL